MSKNQSNVQHVLVGGAVSASGATTLNSTFIAATGEIGIFTSEGIQMNTTNAATESKFIVAQARGAAGEPKVLVTEVIDKAKIKSIKKKAYAAAAQQVDYIGYNGTSGSIEVNANELYYIELYLEEYITSSHDGRYIKHGQFNSNSSSTQVSIANGLVASLVNNFSREPKQLIKFERVTSSTVTGATTGTLAVVNGSKYVTAATDIDNGGAVAGDYLVISGVAYKIITINVGGAQVAELDIPYQGTTNTAIADASVGFITAANAAAGDWGLKLTGVAQPWTLEKKFDKVVRWTANLSDDAFGATAVTKSVGASEGTGTYKQVAELERFCQRNDNDHYRIGQPNLFDPRQDASSSVSGGGYDLLQIVYEQEEVVGFVGNVSPKVLTLCIPATTPTYATGGGTGEITDVLEVLANVAAGSLAI